MQGAGSDIQNDNPLVMLKHIEARCSPWGPVISHFVEKVPWQSVCNSCAMGQVLPSYQRINCQNSISTSVSGISSRSSVSSQVATFLRINFWQKRWSRWNQCRPAHGLCYAPDVLGCEAPLMRPRQRNGATGSKDTATDFQTNPGTMVLLSSRHHSGLSNQISSSRSFRPGHVCSAWPQMPENVGETCRQ